MKRIEKGCGEEDESFTRLFQVIKECKSETPDKKSGESAKEKLGDKTTNAKVKSSGKYEKCCPICLC
jgi:hypothetical protein